MTVDVAYAQRPHPGFDVSGDAAVHRVWEDGTTLFGVVDALGHGPRAAEVATAALEYLEKVDGSLSLESIVEGLHAALGRTRGAASGLCLARDRVLDLSIVGNVEMKSAGTPIGVISSPGILGRRVRKFRYSRSTMRAGDRLVVFSDGLSRVDLETVRRLGPADACRDLLQAYARTSDDATVVVADFSS